MQCWSMELRTGDSTIIWTSSRGRSGRNFGWSLLKGDQQECIAPGKRRVRRGAYRVWLAGCGAGSGAFCSFEPFFSPELTSMSSSIGEVWVP